MTPDKIRTFGVTWIELDLRKKGSTSSEGDAMGQVALSPDKSRCILNTALQRLGIRATCLKETHVPVAGIQSI